MKDYEIIELMQKAKLADELLERQKEQNQEMSRFFANAIIKLLDKVEERS